MRGSVVVTLLDQCLAAYPPAEWRRLEQQLAALPAFGRQVRSLTRLLLSRACDCDLDSQGRILVPPALRAVAGLEREAVLIGALDRFEVWRPEAWEQFLKESERLLDDLTPRHPLAAVPRARPRGRPGPGAAPPSTGETQTLVHFPLDTPQHGPLDSLVEKCGKKWCSWTSSVLFPE